MRTGGATAVYVLAGGSSIWPIVALQALYGIGGGLVTPAETGLIPQTVSPARLQEANALLGMARNALRVIGPSIAGVIIVAATPGSPSPSMRSASSSAPCCSH